MYPNSTTECHPLFSCLLSHFLYRPSDVSTQLRDQNCDTSSLSGSDTPFTVPALALYPPCTPTSSCLSATPRSPSLTSWDSWSSFESTDEEDVSSTDSELSLSDSHFTSSDDDNEDMEDENECLSSTTAGNCNEVLQAEFGTEIIDNSMHVFPVVSSGIVADCSTQGDDNDFESYQFITLSRTSSEEELQMIFGNEDEQQKQNEDTTDEDVISTEHQNPIPTVPAFLSPQITASETLSDQYFQCITTDYCLKSDNSVAVSRTSSEEELRKILDIDDEDTDHNKMVFTELQNTVPGMPAFIPPQVPVHSECPTVTAYQPAETNFVHCSKPSPLTLSLSRDGSHIPTTPPAGPSTVEAEEMWKAYTKHRSTAPEYFLFPPFTPEQEEWIVANNHPFKEYVLQTWQSSIHSSVQGWLEDLVN